MAIVQKIPRLKDTKGNDLLLCVADTRTVTFTVKDASEAVVSLAGKTITCRCNTNAEVGSASNKVFQKDGSIVGDGSAGQFTLALTPTELAASYEDALFYIIDATGSVQVVLGVWAVNILPNPIAA